jgi:hypothetical protein
MPGPGQVSVATLGVPVTVLPQAVYQGTVTSQALVPAPGTVTITFTGLVSDADAASAANGGTFTIEASYDGGTTFALAAGADWQGGNLLLDGSGPEPPGLAWQPDPNHMPSQVRVTNVLPQALDLGDQLLCS